MLLAFIISLVVTFAVLYYFKAKAARNYGYLAGVAMLETNSRQQVQGYLTSFSNSQANASYNFWYKSGVKKALTEYSRSYWHD